MNKAERNAWLLNFSKNMLAPGNESFMERLGGIKRTTPDNQVNSTPCMYNLNNNRYQQCLHVTADQDCVHFRSFCSP